MPAGRSNALSLLQKVNSQLRGERVPVKSKDEDELASYLNNLAQKTQQPKVVNFEEYGDISISSGADVRSSLTPRGRRSSSPKMTPITPKTNKFLKKKKLDSETQNTPIAAEKLQGSNTKTLVKAKNVMNKTKGKSFLKQLSVDSEMDVSSGSEIDMRPGSSDRNFGKDRSKFVKNNKSGISKTSLRSASPQFSQKSSSMEEKQRGNKKNEIVRTLGSVYLTSEEESLAEFIHNLSVSDSSKKQPKNLVAKKHQKWIKKTETQVARKSSSPVERSRSPPFKRSPSPLGKQSRSQSQDSELIDSIDSEILEDSRARNKSTSLDDPIHINLKDLSSLAPASPSPTPRGRRSPTRKERKQVSSKPAASNFKASFTKGDNKAPTKTSKASPKKSNSKTSLFENFGIHMVDELLDVNSVAMPFNDVDISEESEIKTEGKDDRKKVTQRKQSESEIVTDIGGSAKKSIQYLSNGSISEQNSKGRKGRRNIDTDQDYSDSFLSDSESRSTNQSRTFTDSLSKTSQGTKGRRKHDDSKASKSKRKREHKIILEEKHVDISTTDKKGGTHHWNTSEMGFAISGPYGLQYVDPKPVATHVVSADALEALTAYSPNMLALQEMMRAQLNLVRNFVDIQSRIYQSCMAGLSYDYKYTTLEDTKKYIDENRKPTLTFKEALKLVEEEEAMRA
ncbi:unnamed protein product [Lymnaea stagnalis]|uniref:DUF4614 domain-containing protein n=1 Tax=Lymnaea stagnalis TaxID=6523 RepID=A0AAV2IL49_LYMST